MHGLRLKSCLLDVRRSRELAWDDPEPGPGSTEIGSGPVLCGERRHQIQEVEGDRLQLAGATDRPNEPRRVTDYDVAIGIHENGRAGIRSPEREVEFVE